MAIDYGGLVTDFPSVYKTARTRVGRRCVGHGSDHGARLHQGLRSSLTLPVDVGDNRLGIPPALLSGGIGESTVIGGH